MTPISREVLLMTNLRSGRTRFGRCRRTWIYPTDRRRVIGTEPPAATIAFDIPADLHVALTAIARQHNATTFMALHAVLAILLHKITGAEDFAIGTPTSGRAHPAFDSTVGMFAGTVALRTATKPGGHLCRLPRTGSRCRSRRNVTRGCAVRLGGRSGCTQPRTEPESRCSVLC